MGKIEKERSVFLTNLTSRINRTNATMTVTARKKRVPSYADSKASASFVASSWAFSRSNDSDAGASPRHRIVREPREKERRLNSPCISPYLGFRARSDCRRERGGSPKEREGAESTPRCIAREGEARRVTNVCIRVSFTSAALFGDKPKIGAIIRKSALERNLFAIRSNLSINFSIEENGELARGNRKISLFPSQTARHRDYVQLIAQANAGIDAKKRLK